MTKLAFNNISSKLFLVNSQDPERDELVTMGRILMTEHSRKGAKLMCNALHTADTSGVSMISDGDYRDYNEKFQAKHLLYAAKVACNQVGAAAPETYEDFKRQSMKFYTNRDFFKVLQSLYEEIESPIMPRVYSEAVAPFADVIPVGFGETASVTVTSNDIVVFQDSSWGAIRNVPDNTLYAQDITMNPKPRSAALKFKWTQLISNDMDFGRFFANLTAGLYAKTMGMFVAALTTASADATLIPSGLTTTFSSVNWVTLANKLSAVNQTGIGNLVAWGGLVALSKVLPKEATGTTNADMDAAIATLLGQEYVNSGYLGKYMGVKLMPLVDAVVPGTQNDAVTTLLPTNKIWILASNARKPFKIAMNTVTPITIEFDPMRNGDGMIGANMTVALEIAAVFADKVGQTSI